MAKRSKPQPSPTNKVKAPVQHLSVEILAETMNEETRTITARFYSGAKIKRYSWMDGPFMLQFSTDPAHVRMGRLNNGAPVLNAHSDYSLNDVLGVVEKGWIENGQGMATLRFSDRADVQPFWQDIKNKIIRNVSMGAAIHKMKDVTPASEDEKARMKEYLVTDWEPLEISAVPIGADPNAGFLAEDPQDFTQCEVESNNSWAKAQEDKTMGKEIETTLASAEQKAQEPVVDLEKVKMEAVEVERKRTSWISKAVKLAGLPEELSTTMIAEGISTEKASDRIFEKLYEKSNENPIRSANVVVTRDADVTRMAAAENHLMYRFDPVKTKLESGRIYNGSSILDMAKEFLTVHGTNVRGISKPEVIKLALMTTSDFPSLLANVGVKRLRQAYEETQPSYRVWARRAPNAPDLKAMSVVQLGNNPDLLLINEGGEYTSGSLTDGKETYSVLKYGRKINFSLEAMINDDLRGFDRALGSFGNSAARLENRKVYQQLTDNGNLADGVALFHVSSHGGNLATAAAVIASASLVIGRKTMRLQKGLQSEELNLAPRFLIVPGALEQVAYQYTSAGYVPATPATVNEFRAGGRTALEVVVEAVLDANSATAWYLAADSAQIDTVEYCFMDGYEGIFTESQQGFNVDGLDIKARLFFGTKVIDYRGLFKNAGA